MKSINVSLDTDAKLSLKLDQGVQSYTNDAARSPVGGSAEVVGLSALHLPLLFDTPSSTNARRSN